MRLLLTHSVPSVSMTHKIVLGNDFSKYRPGNPNVIYACKQNHEIVVLFKHFTFANQ